MKWAVVGKSSIPHVRKEVEWLVAHLRDEGEDVLLETEIGQAMGQEGHALEELDRQVDLFMTVGGDGTILWTQHATDKPVFGVNVGAIGFLAEVEPPQATGAIREIQQGKYRVEERDKLAAYLDDKRLPDAVNEVTVQTRRIAKLIRFTVSVDDEILDTFRGDGMIVSSATGSTGYAMSVGGPLVHPKVRGMVLAPIAPFRLSARPWVVPADATVRLTLLERDSAQGKQQAKVVVDGQHGYDMATGSVVKVQASERKARYVRFQSGFYERVRTKLTR